MYQGEDIAGLACDDDQSILYIADNKKQRLVQIKYDDRIYDMLNTTEGLTETLYDDIESLGYVSSITVDYRGNVYWSTSQNGQDDGSIFRAKVDDPNDNTIRIAS